MNFNHHHKNIFWTTVMVFLVFFVTAVISAVWGLVGYNIDYGDGVKVGKVTYFNSEGYFWKTSEGTLLINDGTNIEKWDFSVDSTDPRKNELVTKLNQAYDSKIFVKITYIQKMGKQWWHGDTGYFAKKVEFMGVDEMNTYYKEQMIKYIKEKLKDRVSKEEITKNLRSLGWSNEDLNAAFLIIEDKDFR